jgi:hypothetical protein
LGAGEKEIGAGEVGGLGCGLDESLGKFGRLLESVVIVRFDYFFGGIGSVLGVERKG